MRIRVPEVIVVEAYSYDEKEEQEIRNLAAEINALIQRRPEYRSVTASTRHFRSGTEGVKVVRKYL